MSKSKRKINSIKAIIVNQLSKEYKVTVRWVNMCINDERDSEKALKIKKEYLKRYAAIEAALN